MGLRGPVFQHVLAVEVRALPIGAGDCVKYDELAGGDFVRNIKQCIDLLGQVAEVAPSSATRDVARSAMQSCLRGVIRAASVVSA